jgi:hypothetical protein
VGQARKKGNDLVVALPQPFEATLIQQRSACQAAKPELRPAMVGRMAMQALYQLSQKSPSVPWTAEAAGTRTTFRPGACIAPGRVVAARTPAKHLGGALGRLLCREIAAALVQLLSPAS